MSEEHAMEHHKDGEPKVNEAAEEVLTDLDEDRQMLQDAFPICSLLISEYAERVKSEVSGEQVFESIIVNQEPSERSAMEESVSHSYEKEDFNPIGTETSKNRKLFWSEKPTKFLLNRVKHLRFIVGTKPNLRNKKQMWTTISKELCEQGYMFSAIQVEGKFYSLERRYKQITMNGSTKQDLPFEEDLDELFGGRNSIFPEAVLDSDSSNASDMNSDADECLEESPATPKFTPCMNISSYSVENTDFGPSSQKKRKIDSLATTPEFSENSAMGENDSYDDEKEDFNLLVPETQKNKKPVWLEEPTKFLLNRMKDLRSAIGKTQNLKNKRQMWATISKELCEQGHMFSALQVETKFYTLERKYKHMQMKNSKSGSARQFFPFEEEIKELLSERKPKFPKVVLDSETLYESDVNSETNECIEQSPATPIFTPCMNISSYSVEDNGFRPSIQKKRKRKFNSFATAPEHSESSAMEESISDGYEREDFNPIGTGTSKNEKLIWLQEPTKFLLNRMKELQSLVGTKSNLKHKKHMWATISNELCAQGHMFSALQVETKFYSLERKYNLIKMKNLKLGRARQICPFEDELKELIKERNPIYPEAVLDSETLKLPDGNSDSDNDLKPSSATPEVLDIGPTPSKKKKSALENYIEEKKKSDTKLRMLLEENMKRKAERAEERTKMEIEKIDLLKSIVELLKK